MSSQVGNKTRPGNESPTTSSANGASDHTNDAAQVPSTTGAILTEEPASIANEKASNKEEEEIPTKTATGEAVPPSIIKAKKEGKILLEEDDCYDELGFGFSTAKKWRILTVIFLVQVSMNFNTSVYNDGVTGISEEFGVSEQAARCGGMIFLVLYAFGCELWAPWSEELGRWPILQLSLFLVNIWQLPVALAPNFGSILVGRALGGLSSAGGSVTLGMIADLFEAEDQQYAVAFIVFSSVSGPVIGPIVGGPIGQYLNWRWTIWIQLIVGGVVQAIHFFCVPETRSTILMDRIAKKRREAGEEVYGPNELVPWNERFNMKEILITWYRPFKMFVTEPIVLVLSLLSGFSDALIFVFIQSFTLVYEQWGFNRWQTGLVFIAVEVGYLIAVASFIPAFKRNRAERLAKPDDEKAQYESRLWWLLFTAPCLPIGLIGFAWTSGGPPIHWFGSIVFIAVIGISNYSIYMATIDYMICAYGPYSASATGGNGFSRDFLAGVLILPATPFYQNIGNKPLQYASTILFCISAVLVGAVFAIYKAGPALRARSPFAQSLAGARKEHRHHHDEKGGRPRASTRRSTQRAQQETFARPGFVSRRSTRVDQLTHSRQNSANVA